MKTVNGIVEVQVGQAGWNFPRNNDGTSILPIRTADNAKQYYQIHVTYRLLEASDVTLADGVSLGVEDWIAEANAGIKLAQGDLAKKPYRANKVGKAEQKLAAMKWLLMSGDSVLMATYMGVSESEQEKWLAEAYAAHKSE